MHLYVGGLPSLELARSGRPAMNVSNMFKSLVDMALPLADSLSLHVC